MRIGGLPVHANLPGTWTSAARTAVLPAATSSRLERVIANPEASRQALRGLFKRNERSSVVPANQRRRLAATKGAALTSTPMQLSAASTPRRRTIDRQIRAWRSVQAVASELGFDEPIDDVDGIEQTLVAATSCFASLSQDGQREFCSLLEWLADEIADDASLATLLSPTEQPIASAVQAALQEQGLPSPSLATLRALWLPTFEAWGKHADLDHLALLLGALVPPEGASLDDVSEPSGLQQYAAPTPFEKVRRLCHRFLVDPTRLRELITWSRFELHTQLQLHSVRQRLLSLSLQVAGHAEAFTNSSGSPFDVGSTEGGRRHQAHAIVANPEQRSLPDVFWWFIDQRPIKTKLTVDGAASCGNRFWLDDQAGRRATMLELGAVRGGVRQVEIITREQLGPQAFRFVHFRGETT